MFFTKEKEEKISSRQDAMFETIMDEFDSQMIKLKHEVTDIIFSVAMAGKIKPKDIANNYSIVKLKKFAEDLGVEVRRRIDEERVEMYKIVQKQMQDLGVECDGSKACKKAGQKGKKLV